MPCRYTLTHGDTQVRPTLRLFTLHILKAAPVITVGELHVHAVAAQESLTVQGDVHVWWVLDRLTHDDEAWQQGLLVATEATVRGAVVVDSHLSSAVQDLGTSNNRRQKSLRMLKMGQGFRHPQLPGYRILSLQPTDNGLPSRWLTWGWQSGLCWSLCISFSWRSHVR